MHRAIGILHRGCVNIILYRERGERERGEWEPTASFFNTLNKLIFS